MALGTAGALLAGSLASSAIGAGAAGKAAGAASAAAKNETALQKYIYDLTYGNLEGYRESGDMARQARDFMLGLGDAPVVGGDAPDVESYEETLSGREVATRNSQGDAGTRMVGGGTRERFRVGGQSFDTREAAEAYANENRTGGKTWGGYMESPMAKYLLEKGVGSIEGSAAAGGGLYSGATLEALEKNRRDVIGADVDRFYDKLSGVAGMGQNAAVQQGSAGQYYASQSGNAMSRAADAAGAAAYGRADAIQTGIGDIAGIYGYFGNPMGAFANSANAGIRPMANPYY